MIAVVLPTSHITSRNGDDIDVITALQSEAISVLLLRRNRIATGLRYLH